MNNLFKLKSYLTFALRNIGRHKFRSTLSVIMIASSIAGIIVFKGFAQNGLAAVKDIAAENQYGHIQIAKKSYWKPGTETRKDKMFELNFIDQLKANNPQIERVSGRLSFYGLLVGPRKNVDSMIIGIDTKIEDKFHKTMRILEGTYFTNSNVDEILIGNLLARQLKVKPNDTMTILAKTIDGTMNAIDVKVAGFYTAGIDEVDGKIAYIPLTLAQKILDTGSVDIAVVKYSSLNLVEGSKLKLAEEVGQIDKNLQVKTWRELSKVFRQSEKFYGVQNSVVQGILITLMFLSILNSVFMSIVERTGEIGVLRALGVTRMEIVMQFLLESLIISIIGIVTGIVSAYIIIQIIHAANIITDVPGASTPFQVKITFMMWAVYFSSFMAALTTLLATFLPARFASRLDIVESLRKNI